MSDTIPDGYYRLDDEESSFVAYFHNGISGDEKAESYLEEGYTFEPVVVLTKDAHDALAQRIAELEAQLAEAQHKPMTASSNFYFETDEPPDDPHSNIDPLDPDYA